MSFCYTELTTGTCEVTFSGSPQCCGGSGVHRRPGYSKNFSLSSPQLTVSKNFPTFVAWSVSLFCHLIGMGINLERSGWTPEHICLCSIKYHFIRFSYSSYNSIRCGKVVVGMEYAYVFRDLYNIFENTSIILILLNLYSNVCSLQNFCPELHLKIFYFIQLYQEETFYFITLHTSLQFLFSIAWSVLLTSCCLW